MTRKWGRAGERLDGGARARQLRAAAGRTRSARRVSDQEAYRRWHAGLVCPDRITAALDMHQLYGPEVDLACKAHEPEVDQWEAGERYPSWEQLCALADLTGLWPIHFTDSTHPSMPLWETSMWHKMTAAERSAYEKHYRPPIMRYPRAALDERPPAPPEAPDTRPSTPTRKGH